MAYKTPTIRKISSGVKLQHLYSALITSLEKIGIRVEETNFFHYNLTGIGHLFKLKEEEIILLNKKAIMAYKVLFMIEILKKRDEIKQIFLPPIVRKILEEDDL